ncbi:MAG: T9SS type A sorting domain-containing protein [Bacteroidetes bacterium]|nr:T9SS type A sorting domain-containing protein [Bacteroidota bacterium]
MDDLVTNSGGVVTFGSGYYTVNDTIKVKAGDTLYINTDITVKFAAGRSLACAGTLYFNPPTGILFTPVDTTTKFSGVRIDSSNSSVIRKLTLEYSVALRVNDGSAIVDSCIFSNNGLIASNFTNAAIVVLRTNNRMTVSNCQFLNNYRAAIQSGSNISTPMTITDNYFIGNDRLLVNTPQINLANSGVGDTIKITNNTLLKPSTNCGGISFLSSSGQLNAIVTGNVIKNNRYGINVQGGNSITYVRIAYNQIDSNNIQNSPSLGGSGIACSGGTAVSQPNTIITGNLIRWNLWGVTIQNRHKPNLGNITNADTSDDGKNVFVNNTNGTTPFIDLYDNSIDSIYAQNNFWNTSNIDSVALKIFDNTDNTALGVVYSTPIKSATPKDPTNVYYGNNGASGTALYYFANSLPGGTPSPSQPEFSWRDTTGSTSLIVSGVAVTTISAGTVNDGRFDVTGQFGGDFVRFFGTSYLQMYVGTNGIINFNPFTPTGSAVAPPSTGLPTGLVTTAVFPLWMDFDFSTGPVPNRLSYKITANEIIVTYDNAFVSGGSSSEYVTFQVVMEKRSSSSQNSRIVYQYDFDHTGADFINLYNNNTLPTHLVGLNFLSSGSNYAMYRFKTSNTLVAAGPLFGSPLAVAFGPDNTQLPVELASFTANTVHNNVNLNWSTVSELNNNGFDIERKTASSSWVKVGYVNGNGTSNNSHSYSFVDNNLSSGKYNYRLKQTDYNGNFEYFNLSGEVIIGVPEKFELSQNYPNPFNPSTKIAYSLPFDSKVEIRLYDVMGREVMTLENSVQTAGYHSVVLNASTLSSGIYFYKLIANSNEQQFSKTLKMLLVK